MIHVFRADTGEHLKWVRWFDPNEGVYCRFRIDPKIAEAGRIHPDKVSEIVRAPIRFVESRAAVPGKSEPLPEELERMRTTFEKCVAVRGRECCYPGCHDLAVVRATDHPDFQRKRRYATADLQQCPPIVDGDGQEWQRVIVTGTRWFCWRSAHYLAPKVTSIRGVESELPIQVARP